jgi:CheY-like chemotaxis protein
MPNVPDRSKNAKSAGEACTQNPDGAKPRRSRNPKRVLIVDDNIDTVRSLSLVIRSMGHAVEYAINGYAALTKSKRFLPHVVLLDLGLPGVDGFEVCSRIKNDPQTKDARVIVITGYSQDHYRIRSQASGCEAHLIKPVPMDVIERLLA